jgi:hypothetical protein
MPTPSPLRAAYSVIGAIVAALSMSGAAPQVGATQDADPLAWPKPTAENRPWTRWWWLGSGVDKENLTLQLQQFKDAGIGGVEICPIYGAKGYEDRYIDFLSPNWMDMLAHTITEAKRLGLGIDMTTGTGWPFGGPEVTTEDAIAKVVLKSYDVAGGASLKVELPKGVLQCLIAVSADGQRIDLTAKASPASSGVQRIDWTAPSGQWRVYAVVMAPSGMIVKRPAPGGEGLVIDPYSPKALDKYLGRFDKAFATLKTPMPRSQFHDSFEYGNATWTPDFLREFEQRRGYDLRDQLPTLFGAGPAETGARVKYDYRLTIAELHLDWVKRWTAWCHRHGTLSRNQAHGAPANLIDVYAAADIPETESYKKIDDRLLPMQKLASSAAHLSGRQLVSCESFTWLREHFQASLADLKPAADLYFLAGINHIFFHGIPYSPKDAPWPGWQFYASVNFGPYGGIWHDLPEFNAYVTRCQSILQAGKPDNDVLLYFPVHDLWQSDGGGKGGAKGGRPAITAMQFTTPGAWMYNTPFHDLAMDLWKRGYTFDQVSDDFLAKAKMTENDIELGSNTYKAVVVPRCRFMPEGTLAKLVELAKAGGKIIFQDELPGDVPGLGRLDERRAAFQRTISALPKMKEPKANKLGDQAAIFVGAYQKGLDSIGSWEPEPRTQAVPNKGQGFQYTMVYRPHKPEASIVSNGLQMVRRWHSDGRHYFLVNRSTRALNDWVTLSTPAKSAVLLDPCFVDRVGVAKLRQSVNGVQVYLQLQPGQACVLRTFTDKEIRGRTWGYVNPIAEPVTLAGAWKVRFAEGGPVIPAMLETNTLSSWTSLGDAETKRFAGTALYSLEFDRPPGDSKEWRLDLGRVADSARVKLNGKSLGTLWCPPFQLAVGEHLRPVKNILEVEVTNVAANRIADMDRKGVPWKIFRDANVLSVVAGNLDASKWPIREAGLLGPVTLTPLREVGFDQPPKQALEDLNEIVARQYDKLGADKVNGLFEGDHTHTNADGARMNAAAVVEGLKELKDCPLSNFLAK